MRPQTLSIGWIIVITLAALPLVPWLTMRPLDVRFFDLSTTVTSLGQITGLVGMVLFSLSFFLSSRLPFLEDWFGGMNRVYIAHHITGGTAFLFLLIHPLFLAMSYLLFSVRQAALFLLPGADWSINFGIAALLFLMALLILTYFADIPYQLWRLTHQFLGLALFLGGLHVLFVTSDVTTNMVLRTYMLGMVAIGLLSYTYRTLLGRFLVRRYRYTVSDIAIRNKDILDIIMTPVGKAFRHMAGQFLFVRFEGNGISSEIHPFSISSAPDEPLRISVKILGDYTRNLAQKLKKNSPAVIEGAFGRFTYQNLATKNQIWIAGGIGITPFVGMAKTVSTVSCAIDLYYVVHSEPEAAYLTDITAISESNKHFRVFPVYTSIHGRLTADMVKEISGISGKEVFICGPAPMMQSLKMQFRKLGMPKESIHTEEFQLQ